MIIAQKKPTIVIICIDRVLKVFETLEDTQAEYENLTKFNSHFVKKKDESEYEMALINVINKDSNILILEKAKGMKLSKLLPIDQKYANIIGENLSKFHLNKNINILDNKFLYGDFVLNHIFIDDINKIITLIDPGRNFLVNGNQLEDLARFMYSIVDKYKYFPILTWNIINNFLYSYNKNINIDTYELIDSLRVRRDISIKKYFNERSIFKGWINFLLLYIKYNYLKIIVKISISKIVIK